MLIAVGHVLGAIIALVAFGLAVLALGAWEVERNQKAAVQEASLALGIPSEQINDPSHAIKVIRFAADRCSSELFRNRISDLCGLVRTVWGWIGNAAQAVVLGVVVWHSTSDPSVAVYAWWIVAIAVFFWITSIAFSWICKLITGRYPGQARQGRKLLAQLMESQGGTRGFPG